MIHVDSLDDYSSGVGLLNDFSSDIYRDTIRLYKPIVSGERIVKRTAADLSLVSIDKLIHLDDRDQEALLELFTDFVSVSYKGDWDLFVDRLNDWIKKNHKFKELFDSLDTYFDKLDNYQKSRIIRLTVNKLSGEIESIRNEINDRLLFKESNKKELLLIDQILYLMQNALQKIKFGKSIKRNEQKKIEKELGFSLYILLRLEAYRRGKITVDDLKDDLSSSTFSPKDEYIKPSEYHLIKEVFGE